MIGSCIQEPCDRPGADLTSSPAIIHKQYAFQDCTGMFWGIPFYFHIVKLDRIINGLENVIGYSL